MGFPIIKCLPLCCCDVCVCDVCRYKQCICPSDSLLCFLSVFFIFISLRTDLNSVSVMVELYSLHLGHRGQVAFMSLPISISHSKIDIKCVCSCVHVRLIIGNKEQIIILKLWFIR